MVCPNCNTEFYDENGKCPNCNEYVDIMCQRQKLNAAITRTQKAILEIFKSQKFLTYSVILSIVCGLYSLALFYEIPYSGVVSAAMTYGLYVGFSIVSVTAVWKLRSQTQKDLNKDLLIKLNAFPKLLHIMSMISFVLYIIGAAFLLISVLLVVGNMDVITNDVIPEIKAMITEVVNSGMIELEDGVTTSQIFDIIDVFGKYIVYILIAIMGLLVGSIILAHYKKKMYKSMTEFISGVESTSITFAYISPMNFSSKLILVIGIIDIVISAPLVIFVGVGALAPLMQGVWLIVTSKLFAEIDAKLKASSGEIFEERRILENMVMYYRRKEEEEAKNKAQNEGAEG